MSTPKRTFHIIFALLVILSLACSLPGLGGGTPTPRSGPGTALAPTARLWVFGHIGDGNLHLNVSGLDPDDERVDEAVLGLVAEAGGSISAEHGIGAAKARWLPLARSPEEIRAFGAIKAALDPDGILNPGVLL